MKCLAELMKVVADHNLLTFNEHITQDYYNDDVYFFATLLISHKIVCSLIIIIYIFEDPVVLPATQLSNKVDDSRGKNNSENKITNQCLLAK